MGELSMSRKEREEFLAETHVGILSVTEEGGRAPLSIPIWYRYEPGGAVHFITGLSNRSDDGAKLGSTP